MDNSSLQHIFTCFSLISFPWLKHSYPCRNTHLAVDNYVDRPFLDDVPRCAFLSLVEHWKSKYDKRTLAPTCVWNRYIKKTCLAALRGCVEVFVCFFEASFQNVGNIKNVKVKHDYSSSQTTFWLWKVTQSARRKTHTRSQLLRATQRSQHLPVPSSPTHKRTRL